MAAGLQGFSALGLIAIAIIFSPFLVMRGEGGYYRFGPLGVFLILMALVILPFAYGLLFHVFRPARRAFFFGWFLVLVLYSTMMLINAGPA